MTRAESVQMVWRRVAEMLPSWAEDLDARAVDHVHRIAIRLSQPKGQRRPHSKETPA